MDDSLCRGPDGKPGGDLLAGLWTEKYTWVPLLNPEDIKNLCLGAIWNFGKGTGFSWADIRFWGTKDPL
jgi:hypothetical protein